jgi:glycosyltransferase involved in cell wall biosynthesis
MAMGVPVVASTTAAKGVDAEVGRDILVADTPESFAASILGVLERPDERRRLAEAARARVLSHHSWAASMQRLDSLITRCTNAALR